MLRQVSAMAPHSAGTGSAAFSVCSSPIPGIQVEATAVPFGDRDSRYPISEPTSVRAALSKASAASWRSTTPGLG